MCDWCRDYLRQIETTARVVADAIEPEAVPPGPALDALVGAFRARTREDGPR
jgi:hypothetical protein